MQFNSDCDLFYTISWRLHCDCLAFVVVVVLCTVWSVDLCNGLLKSEITKWPHKETLLQWLILHHQNVDFVSCCMLQCASCALFDLSQRIPLYSRFSTRDDCIKVRVHMAQIYSFDIIYVMWLVNVMFPVKQIQRIC